MRERLSLRARLLLAVGAITLLALVLADVVVYTSLRTYLYQQVDASLQTSHQAVEATVENPQANSSGLASPASGTGATPQRENAAPLGSSTFCAVGRETAPGMFIEVRNEQDEVVTSAGGVEECAAFQPGSASYTPKLPAHITGFQTNPGQPGDASTYVTVASTKAGGPVFRVLASELSNGAVLIVADPIGGMTNTLSQLLLVESLVTAGALLAAGVLGLWLVRVGLRPLADIERTADAIAEGNLTYRAPHADSPTEVGRLATAFNVMLERIQGTVAELQDSEDRLRRFVGDASHELRTPTAAVSAYAQLFDRGIASRPEELGRVMAGIQRESSRMAQLVEDLLVLAKLDERPPLESEPVELVGLVLESVHTARAVGPAWPISVQAEEPVEILGDQHALRQVVDNLLSNVRSHTPAGTRCTVCVRRDGTEGVVEVRDDGPGISEEQSSHLFERFFRIDSSRTRGDGGGSGLGLSIVAAIVAAHGGRVVARPGTTGGAVFAVLLPVRIGAPCPRGEPARV